MCRCLAALWRLLCAALCGARRAVGRQPRKEAARREGEEERLLGPGAAADSDQITRHTTVHVGPVGPADGHKQQQQQQQQQQAPAPGAPPPQNERAPPPAKLTRGGLNELSAAAGDAPRSVFVMRHGHRQDEADATWTRVAARPWDPPLSQKGLSQAREAGAGLRGRGVDLVISSPFKRCLQTSAQIVAELGLPQGRWLVDWGLSEVCDPRVLLHGRPDCEHMARGRGVASWMWGGASLPDAVAMFGELCAEELPGLKVRPVALESSQPPPFPETLEAGLKRYARAVQRLVWAYPRRTLLMVTHGECLRAVVNMMEPHSEVFEVRHVGYVELTYSPPQVAAEAAAAAAAAEAAAAGKGGGDGGDSDGDGSGSGDGGCGWRLASSQGGETGVFWLVEAEGS